MTTPLDELAASFHMHLRAERRAERTCTIYLQSVRFYAAWLAEHDKPATVDQLTRSNIAAWLADLSDRNAASTVRTRWRGLYRFCRWAVEEGELGTHPMDGIRAPDAPASPVPVLDDDQLAALIKACGRGRGRKFYARRDEAIIRLLLDGGCRNAELCGITMEQLNLQHEMVMVTGKGSKVRPVYFGPRTARSIDRYLRERRKHRHADSTMLFLGERGALTPDGVREILTMRSELAGIGHVHPHQLRHTWAHDFLVSGGQERDLKRLAGWSSDAMLSHYGASAADERARIASKKMQRGDRV